VIALNRAPHARAAKPAASPADIEFGLDSFVAISVDEKGRELAGDQVIGNAGGGSSARRFGRRRLVQHRPALPTRHELLSRGGIYASLWRRQSGSFLEASAPREEESRSGPQRCAGKRTCVLRMP
jgi:hypothetical protein